MKETKLSKQQKEILNHLCKSGFVNVRMGTLSKRIAIKKGIHDSIHNPYYSYTHFTHIASFSRSIRRLEKRGLINKSYHPINKYDYDYRMKMHPKPYLHVSRDRATSISLTDKGLEYCELKSKENGIRNDK